MPAEHITVRGGTLPLEEDYEDEATESSESIVEILMRLSAAVPVVAGELDDERPEARASYTGAALLIAESTA
jgi:hypothetical protein